jgi:TolB protein
MREYEDYSDLWVSNRDGSNARAVTHNNVTSTNTKDNYWAAQPAWSPDGKQILFLTDRGKVLDPNNVGQYGMGIWSLALSGSPPQASPVVAPEPWTGGNADPTWRPSAAGQFAYTRYHYDASVPAVTGQIALADGTLLTSAPNGAFQPAWSPDGRLLAYIERQGDTDLLRVMVFASPTATTPSRPVTVVSGILSHPVWSPDGGSLAFVALQNDHFVVQTVALTVAGQTITTGTPRTVDGTADIDAASTLSWTK